MKNFKEPTFPVWGERKKRERIDFEMEVFFKAKINSLQIGVSKINAIFKGSGDRRLIGTAIFFRDPAKTQLLQAIKIPRLEGTAGKGEEILFWRTFSAKGFRFLAKPFSRKERYFVSKRPQPDTYRLLILQQTNIT